MGFLVLWYAICYIYTTRISGIYECMASGHSVWGWDSEFTGELIKSGCGEIFKKIILNYLKPHNNS